MSQDLLPGQIRFYDNFIPRLEPGSYKITVEQKLTSSPEVPLPAEPFKESQQFKVEGARFTLGAGDVLSVFPPPNSEAEYHKNLPTITLTKRSLPWERSLGKSSKGFPIPWLALLLFDEHEIDYTAPKEAAKSPTRSVTRTLDEVVDYNQKGVLGPKLDLPPDDPLWETRCRTIDVVSATLNALVPTGEELPYLSHCRQVNTANQEILGLNADGWFALVTGNRFPPEPEKVGQRIPQIAHLVSLEGFTPYLTAPPAFPPDKTIRLVSLASWTFTTFNDGLDFAGLIQGLNKKHTEPSLLQMPVPETPPANTAYAQEAFNKGYSGLDYTTRQGEQTMGWYRGPFLPIHVRRVMKPPFPNSDAAKIYDKDTGLFDVSYAVAWQIGRLLALSDRTFAINLLAWKRAGGSLLSLLQDRIDLFDKYREKLPPPELLAQVLDPRHVSEVVKARIARVLAPRATSRTTTLLPLIDTRDPSGLLQHQADLPGLLSPEQLDDLYARGKDPHEALYQLIFGERR